MVTEKKMFLDGLGLCEYCGRFVFLASLPADLVSAATICVGCNNQLSIASFGYEANGKSGRRKVRWVGPSGYWILERPTSDFNLGILAVQARP